MRLTRGEGWWLLRRQLGWPTVAMATAQAISQDRLRRWERDREPAPMPALLSAQLTPGQWCVIQRRRAGLTLPELSERTGISRMTLWKAEHDRTRGVQVLMNWWRARAPRPRAATPIRVRAPEP